MLRSYSYLPHRTFAFDDSPSAKGSAYYVINNVSNAILQRAIFEVGLLDLGSRLCTVHYASDCAASSKSGFLGKSELWTICHNRAVPKR